MMKGAIVVLAFSLFLLSCQPKTVYLPPLDAPPPSAPPSVEKKPLALPEPAISDITVDETGRVIVTLSNVGGSSVPQRMGNLKIYVGDALKWSIPLGEISDQTFMEPGGVSRYITPVQLEGAHPVRAIIDDREKIGEGDGLNDLMTKILSFQAPVLQPPPPSLSLPAAEVPKEIRLFSDVTLTDLSLNQQRKLLVHLSNNGDAPFTLQEGTLEVFVDDVLRSSYSLGELSDKPLLSPKERALFSTPLTIIGRHEVFAHLNTSPEANERTREKKGFKKILESLPPGPDIIIKELVLTEDFELSIVLSNAGKGELRRGTTLRIRIFLNDRKVSEFDHLVTESLRPNMGSHYRVDPPYRVQVSGNMKVKVVILPKQASDDIRLENNTLETNFMILPFRIDPRMSREFSFLLSSSRSTGSLDGNKVKTEARWDGGGAPLKLSLKRARVLKRIAPVSGKSPLRLEIPIGEAEDPRGEPWRLSVTNLMEKRAEGNLILQFP
jgi:hypothetical protein